MPSGYYPADDTSFIVGEASFLLYTTNSSSYFNYPKAIAEVNTTITVPEFRLTNESGASRAYYYSHASDSASAAGWLKVSGTYRYR